MMMMIRGVGLGTGGEQQLEGGSVAALGGAVERLPHGALAAAGGGAGLQKRCVSNAK